MKETFSRVTSSTSFKFVVIGILSLLLLIPVGMIRNLIRERQNRSSEAAIEVSEKWGLEQTLTGPFLTIPLKETWSDDGKKQHIRKNLHVLPEDLRITGDVIPEEKKRGIYRVVVYHSDLTISGKITLDEDLREQIDEHELIDQKAYLCMGISDLRGIKKIAIRSAGTAMKEMSGLPTRDIDSKGVHIPLSGDQLREGTIPFEIKIELDGSGKLAFIPVGKNTSVNLSSSWSDPSFEGAFLPIPSETEVSQQGFNASWQVNYLNRSYPQHWFNKADNPGESAFGVNFLVPVDHYQKSMRSVKYALMFIVLSFLIFFLTELLNGIRLHPIQYLLVGMALVVFYTLLISLAEHMGFNLAYLFSAIATLGLISFYIRASTGSNRQGIITGSLLLVLYSFLFTTLQLQDFSLLFGSVGIFAVIAIIMFVSRKVNWYKESPGESKKLTEQ